MWILAAYFALLVLTMAAIIVLTPFFRRSDRANQERVDALDQRDAYLAALRDKRQRRPPDAGGPNGAKVAREVASRFAAGESIMDLSADLKMPPEDVILTIRCAIADQESVSEVAGASSPADSVTS